MKKNKKIEIISAIIIGLVLLAIGVALSMKNGEEHKKKEEKPKVNDISIPQDSYEVSYVIDEKNITLTFVNKTNKDINVSKIIIKNGKEKISENIVNYKILLNTENTITFHNNMNLESTAKITLELYYNEKEIETGSKEEIDTFLCSIPKEETKEYKETYYYKFKYADGNLYLPEVYREYQFQEEEALKNFILRVTPDDPDDQFNGKMIMDREHLINKYYFDKEYPIPDDIKNINEYLKYLKSNFEYDCKKIN